MHNRDVNRLLIATVALSSLFRLSFAGLMLWAFQEAETPALRLGLWFVGISMIVYVIWRIYKFYNFMKKGIKQQDNKL